ncbi:MAG: ATP-binding protein, partial [Planctomycetaceae bacterium]|nr:ATP-binding protein [Planctomycetaceae bacterium]
EVLESVPKAEYGAYLTVDRDEIERINAVRSLILTYLDNPADARPLSLAVFGQPGSGKSFAIKHLLKSLPGGNVAPLTFNLSEFPDDSTEALRQLHAALHEVRDKAISGSVPVVFWDEFDSGNLKWLKQFLAPMQDAEFREGSTVHPLGRAIFIFAGGTSHSFQDFTSGIDKLKDQSEKKYIKGPDFVSRLRGHINIKGPNPDVTKCGESNSRDKLDPAHIIRRAVQLRSMLERTYPQLIDKTTKKLAISESVLHGLLRVSEYRHGVRSLESVLTMSQLAGAAYFGISQLPPKEQLEMHVADDFLEGIRQGELTGDIIEPLAEACHESYEILRMIMRLGEPIGDIIAALAEARHEFYRMLRMKMRQTNVKEYVDLDEADKESNRAVARVVAAKLHEVKCKIRRRQTLNDPLIDHEQCVSAKGGLAGVEETLQILEHDRWLREKLMRGFEYVELSGFDPDNAEAMDAWFQKESRFKKVRRNWNIQRYDNLHPKFKELDRVASQQIAQKLHEFGYEIVKLDAPGG